MLVDSWNDDAPVTTPVWQEYRWDGEKLVPRYREVDEVIDAAS